MKHKNSEELKNEQIKELINMKKIPTNYRIYTTLRIKARELGICVKGLTAQELAGELKENIYYK